MEEIYSSPPPPPSPPRPPRPHESPYDANGKGFAGKVFVTGAAGHLGANLLHRLLSDGRAVAVLLRPNDNNEAIDAVERATGHEVERVMGDLRDAELVQRGMAGCESAFHVAAKVSTVGGDAADLRELFECNVIGTANLLRAARDSGVKRVVVTGSFSAVGYDDGDPSRPSDESMPFRPFDDHLPYGRTKMLVEHECLKAVAEGQDVVIATSCAVLGPWDYIPSRMGRTLIDFANGRLRAYVPGGFEFVAAKDIVEGHLLAMKRGRAGQRYILSTEFLTVDKIMDIFEDVSGRPRPKLRLPPPVMAGLAEVSSFVLTKFFPKVPQRFTPGAVRILRMQRHANLTKAKTELGYVPTRIHAAIEEAYADFARRGLVPPKRGLARDERAEERAADEGHSKDANAKATVEEKGLSV
jgi:nucleoside-diphosphate-sugar epimerase